MSYPASPRTLWPLGRLPATLLAPIALLALSASAGCSKSDSGTEAKAGAGGSQSLTLGAYTTPREVYSKLLPAFRNEYRTKTGQDLDLRDSYLGSGAQARAIVAGFEADIAALSLEPDIDTLTKAKLITHDWKAGEHGGMVTRSVVVIGVRPGNPKNIRDWDDLAKPGIEVLTPNVRTSGGAMWNVAAVYGAALRGHTSAAAGNADAAAELLTTILRNVKIMDRSARDSMLTFERGVGDAIITYENEMLVGRMKGQTYEYVIPKSTILIENPVAIIDANVDRHGNRAAAEAFVQFLFTPESQRAFAEHGLRPVVASIEAETKDRFPPVTDLFTAKDLGGWAELQTKLFGEGGAYDKAVERSRTEAAPQ